MRSQHILLALIATAVGFKSAYGQEAETATSVSARSPQRAFVENCGQWCNGSLFQMRRGNSVVAVRRDGFTIQMLRIDHSTRGHSEVGCDEPGTVSGWNLALTFRGASPSAVVEGIEELPGVYNYLRGSDPASWVTHVRGFARVRIAGLYPGIDLDLYERDGALEYDILLWPGANASCIVLEAQGADAVTPDADGGLVVHTPWQDVVHSAAKRVSVGKQDPDSTHPLGVSFRQVSETGVTFDVSGWDGLRPLVVDPSVVYSTCLGGTGNEDPDAIAAADGEAVVAGEVSSTDFPVTAGAFQSSQMGSLDSFVTRLSAGGDSLVYSTYFGGSNGESIYDVTLAPDGAAVVCGTVVFSPEFPVTVGAYDTTPSGPADGFVARFTADGSGLDFCTLIGGSADDPATRVRIAPDRTVLVTGLTHSPDFPTTPNAFANTLVADVAAYVSRFSADGSQLLSSTLLGGSAATMGRGLGVDSEGNAYITGYASGNPGTPLPVTPGAFDTVGNGQVDAFVAKFSPDLSSLAYCTYLGGGFNDEAWGLAVDGAGAAYVTGTTSSFSFPTTPGALHKSKVGGQDAFVAKLDPTGSFLEFSTYLGGVANEDADDIAVGPDGSVFVAGDTTSPPTSFPVTPDGWDITLGGDGDSYLVRLDPAGSKVTYGTYIGGNGDFIDECRAMGLDEHGDAFVAGEAFSPDFPTTPGAFDPTMTDFKDSFVVRIAFGPWTVLGGALKGTGSVAPWLQAWGTLEPGSAGELSLLDAAPNAPATLVLGLSQLEVAFKGGTMMPAPLVLLPLVTDSAGEVQLDWQAWPSGIPAGTEFYLQAWVADTGGPKGYAASQAVKALTP